MKTIRPCKLYGHTVPAGSAFRPLSAAERLALVFERGPTSFDVACGLLDGEAVEFDDGRKVFVERELAEGWPAPGPEVLDLGVALRRHCENVLRMFKGRQCRRRVLDELGRWVAVTTMRRPRGALVIVYVRESEAVAMVGACRSSGASRAWPMGRDPAIALRAADAWLRDEAAS